MALQGLNEVVRFAAHVQPVHAGTTENGIDLGAPFFEGGGMDIARSR